MECPNCKFEKTYIIETRDFRSIEGPVCTRRRRICLECRHRFTTVEEQVDPEKWEEDYNKRKGRKSR